MNTPVLFLLFNRPDQTKRVFEAIRAVRPARLFIAADGARPSRPDEADLCREAREAAAGIDWPCTVERLFREENLGCGRAVSSAISWFFDQVEEGIILEDDCLPHPDFFPYCQALLARYRDEPRIATVAGTHFLPAECPHAASHYVSKYFQMWGWATWRRLWRQIDLNLARFSLEDWFELLKRTHPLPVESGYWFEILKSLHVGGIDTWDFQVFFNCWRLGANHVMPGRNLISNIGYGHDATHTSFASPMADLPTFALTVDETPIVLEPNPTLDSIIFFLRFLDSLTHTWWLEPVLAPDRKLSEARTELSRCTRQIQMLETERHVQRGQLRAATRALARAHSILNSRRALLKHLLVPQDEVAGGPDGNGVSSPRVASVPGA